MFGNAADDLPYFECSPNGRNAGMAFECASENVTTFPTWTIGTPPSDRRAGRRKTWPAIRALTGMAGSRTDPAGPAQVYCVSNRILEDVVDNTGLGQGEVGK